MNYGGVCLVSTLVSFFYAIAVRREERKSAFIFGRVGLFTYGLIPIKCIFVFSSMNRQLQQTEYNLENQG